MEITGTIRRWLAEQGAKGGKNGTGLAKKRTTEQARAAAKAMWAKKRAKTK